MTLMPHSVQTMIIRKSFEKLCVYNKAIGISSARNKDFCEGITIKTVFEPSTAKIAFLK